jgi:hypothetical protein
MAGGRWDRWGSSGTKPTSEADCPHVKRGHGRGSPLHPPSLAMA